ncbi:preprotein translocase subunit SecA [bacterium CG10_37_50]|nr:MAG: preprotein translocase subunit SecA [bacterium CG10_37_50]
MANILQTLFGDPSTKYLKTIEASVQAINALEPSLKALSDEALKAKTLEFQTRLKNGETEDDLLVEAFAVIRETASRVLGQRHFDVQLLGGITLHSGKIAEMRTGEGKTLVATLPAYLNALSGRGVHIVTVNDYLARRDATWMGQIYAFHGLSVGVLNNQTSYLYDTTASQSSDQARDERGSFLIVYDFLRPCSRQEVYQADIIYGTNNEYGFDYLRDNLVYEPAGAVQRVVNGQPDYNFAIIDEVDSILIDEARTPLIISAPSGETENLYQTFSQIARQLDPQTDYEIDEKLKAISLTDAGITKAEKLLGVGDIYSEKGVKYVHHLETAVRAKALFLLDRDYVVREGEVVIVDEFTGRLQPGRRWSEGLHQAIESKEGVEIKEETRTFATVTLQNYFRQYRKLAGMTGTAVTSREEFLKTYNLDVIAVPSNRVAQRLDLPDLIFQTEHGKMLATAREIKALHQKGQPVLAGTVSIEKNELLSTYLTKEGVPHQVLNAKNHEKEGEIIASAGKLGSVVIATNMAGRGVDIKLGGATPSPEETKAVLAVGGLFVLGTERHEARRIDNQLRGRSGRQGDPGTTRFFLSLEDNLMRVFAPDRIKNMMGRLGIPEDEAIQNGIVSKAIESAQGKIEGLNFDMRKYLLEYDDVTNHQRQTIYERRRNLLYGEAKVAASAFLERAFSELNWTEEEKADWRQKIDARKKDLGEDTFWLNTRRLALQVIDMYWVEHLEAIEYMRNSVRLRAYGQRDPLVEFKKEGLRLFKDMEAMIFASAIEMTSRLGQELKTENVSLQAVKEGAEEITATNQTNTNQAPKKEVGRNDPCPCGSGKKYKKCHGT